MKVVIAMFFWVLFFIVSIYFPNRIIAQELPHTLTENYTYKLIQTYIAEDFLHYSDYISLNPNYAGEWNLTNVYYGPSPKFRMGMGAEKIYAIATSLKELQPIELKKTESFYIDHEWNPCDQGKGSAYCGRLLNLLTQEEVVAVKITHRYQSSWPYPLLKAPRFIDLNIYRNTDGGYPEDVKASGYECIIDRNNLNTMYCFYKIIRVTQNDSLENQLGNFIFKFERILM